MTQEPLIFIAICLLIVCIAKLALIVINRVVTPWIDDAFDSLIRRTERDAARRERRP